eukprot:TRINITY_DN77582_c0_g1_i1.p1 TRINITY_DN77582_c0_g1~~TRINITY_DN77582_c0_g1_i1.p1  ORF type:complete len:653 (-),score=92.94 TRINITY_DN77582_c0_g1_i1:79-2037(-)
MEAPSIFNSAPSVETPPASANSGHSGEAPPASTQTLIETLLQSQARLEARFAALSQNLEQHREELEDFIEDNFKALFLRVELLAELTTQVRNRSSSEEQRRKAVARGKLSPETASILGAYGFMRPSETPQVQLPGSSGESESHSSDSQAKNPRSDTSSPSAGLQRGYASDLPIPRPRHRRHKPKQVLSASPELHAVVPADHSPYLPLDIAQRRHSSPVAHSPLSDAASVLPNSACVPHDGSTKNVAAAAAPPENEESSEEFTASGSLKAMIRTNDADLLNDAMMAQHQSVREGSSLAQKYAMEDLDDLKVAPWTKVVFRLGFAAMRVVGIEPWRPKQPWSCLNYMFRCWWMLANVLFLTSSVIKILRLEFPHISRGSDWLFVDIVLGLSTFLVLPSMGLRPSTLRELQNNTDVLFNIAREKRFEKMWKMHVSKDFVAVIILWCAAVAERMRHTFSHEFGVLDSVHICLFAMSSFTQASITHAIVLRARCLNCILERFLIDTATGQHKRRTELYWKARAALLRRLSIVMERCILLMVSTGTLIAFFLLLDIHSGHRTAVVAPGLLLLYSLAMIWVVAGVTDTCQRMPPVISSLTARRWHGRDALHLVQAISASEAGIYVYDTKVSKSMIVKFVYVTGIALFGISTNILELRFI